MDLKMTFFRLNFIFAIVFFSFFLPILHSKEIAFLKTRKDIENWMNSSNSIVIASSGRSGSTLLFDLFASRKFKKNVIKTHLLPPISLSKAKTIFIFSNPDQCAESSMYKMMESSWFFFWHVRHCENSIQEWHLELQDSKFTSLDNHPLAKDGLAVAEQIQKWVFSFPELEIKEANLMCVKYENLWEPATILAIEKFLKIRKLPLPAFKQRGYSDDQLSDFQKQAREIYNYGTKKNPKYHAYDEARELWEKAPAYKFCRMD
jgi:hypothetical protein